MTLLRFLSVTLVWLTDRKYGDKKTVSISKKKLLTQTIKPVKMKADNCAYIINTCIHESLDKPMKPA